MDQKSKKYFSMMGLLNEQNLSGIYNNNNMWHKFNSLQEVLDDMPKDEDGIDDKHSIPDVYGRAIQLQISFEYLMKMHALNNKYMPTREILNWRGILTMLALQKFHHFDISFETIDYKKNIAMFTGQSGRSLGDVFDKALSYPPKKSMFPDAHEWEDGIFHMICIKGTGEVDKVDMAVFSPLTLIYPVADLEKIISKVNGIRWFDYKQGVFLNPAEVLSKGEKAIVCFWLDCLSDELREMAQSREANVQSMIRTVYFHLEQYMSELQAEMPASEWKEKKCFEVTEIDKDFGNAEQTVVDRLLNRTINLMLYFSEARKIEYDEVFSSQLYFVPKGEEAFSGHCKYVAKHKIHNSSNWYAFIPLGRKVVDTCSREEIEALVQNLDMRLKGNLNDYGVHVEVKLRSSSILGNIDMEKNYYKKKKEMIEGKESFPAIALWPPEYNPGWKRYYIYLNGIRDNIELDLDDMQKGENAYVSRLESFPYAIALKREKKYDIGVILLNYIEKKAENMANVSATVGIDFGTSGTTVYAKIDNMDSPVLINIGEDTAEWIIPGDGYDVRMMSEYFISVVEEMGELYSIYRMPVENMQQQVEPLLGGVIYQAQENKMIDNSPNFLTGMKWNIANSTEYYQAFVEELCLHIRRVLYKYGVTNIIWRYALPQGIVGAHLYRQIWGKNIQDFLDSTVSDAAHSIISQEYTESEAASLYFLHAPEISAVNLDKGYLVVDIGGGSMDIAVWQRKEGKEVSLVAQTSIAVAGRLLFTRWLALSLNLEKIIATVFQNDPLKDQLKKLQEIKDVNIVNAVLERIVNSQSGKIMKAYIQKSEWARRVEGQLEFGMALLFYALGSLVGYLKEKEKLLERDDTGNFCIALGGNGSKIMNWLNCEKELNEMFEKGLESRAASSEYYKAQVILSQKPKKEVAYGLVQEKDERFTVGVSDIKEEISNEMAMNWNEDFKNNYNRLFGKNNKIDRGEICNIMSKCEREKDVCNFFMTDMYVKYYMKLITEEF